MLNAKPSMQVAVTGRSEAGAFLLCGTSKRASAAFHARDALFLVTSIICTSIIILVAFFENYHYCYYNHCHCCCYSNDFYYFDYYYADLLRPRLDSNRGS